MTWKTVTLLALAAGLSACADAAKPDLQRCQKLEAEQKLEEAIAACELATSKGPESRAGKEAAEKIPVLQRAIARATEEKLAAESAKKDQLAKKSQETQEEREAKAKQLEELRERLQDPNVRKAYQEQLEKAKPGGGK